MSYRKSMLLNPFSVTDLRPEVELIHWLHMAKILLSCLKQAALDRLRVRLSVILLLWWTFLHLCNNSSYTMYTFIRFCGSLYNLCSANKVIFALVTLFVVTLFDWLARLMGPFSVFTVFVVVIYVFGAVDKTSSSFSAHGKIGNFIIIVMLAFWLLNDLSVGSINHNVS